LRRDLRVTDIQKLCFCTPPLPRSWNSGPLNYEEQLVNCLRESNLCMYWVLKETHYENWWQRWCSWIQSSTVISCSNLKCSLFIKSKVSPLPAHRAVKACIWDVDLNFHAFLTSTLRWHERTFSLPAWFTLPPTRKISSCTHSVRGWVGRKTDPKAAANRKILFCQGSKPGHWSHSQSV
jgi:hypothetical protein